MSKEDSKSNVVKMFKVRIAFCKDLFAPGKFKDGDTPRYTSTAILPPDHPALKQLRKTINDVAKEAYGSNWEKALESLERRDLVCLRNGDDKADYEGFEGNWFVNAAAPVNKKPLVKDHRNRTLTEEDGVIYPGCYVNMSVSIYHQNNQYGKRINATLRSVQYAGKAEPFGGGGVADENEWEEMDIGEEEAEEDFM